MATTRSDREMRRAETPTGDLETYAVADTYHDWIKQEGVRHIVDFAFEDLKAIEMTPWERKGGRGAIITIPNEHLATDSHVVELAPGAKSAPEHHMYEEVVYVLSGRGATSVWTDEKRKQTFEWHEGSLFAIPLNAWYQHFNASGSEPARYIAVTNAPPMMRLFRNNDFIFNSDYMFTDRFPDDDAYFNGTGKLYKKRRWETNFIPSTANMALYDDSERGAGNINVDLEMASGGIKPHMSEFPVGTYKKAHRHGPGAHLILLRGTGGFSLLWQEGQEPRKADWKEGALVIVPDEACFHQHFNTGSTPARYLAVKGGNHGLMEPL